MPEVINIEVLQGRQAAASPASKIIQTTQMLAKADDEVSGHYASSRVVKCWSCGGISYAVTDDALANQMFACPACGQMNQL